MKIHFIGIGGIGVSALAQYYLAKGHKISGSDLVCSEIIEDLRKKGVKINLGKNIIKKDADLNIYTPAAKIRFPQKRHIISYPEALGELTKKYFTIAVCGTHGKSTTTAMIGLILTRAGLDPTVIVGTKVKEFGHTNCRVGSSKYLVIEADEHFGSFLNYWPKMIVLTNIEPDHLDYYKNFRALKNAFQRFIHHLPKDGTLIVNRTVFTAISTPAPANVVDYALKGRDRQTLKKILKVPGEHNILNALAALTAARVLKIPDKTIFEALSEFQGVWRRFEIINKNPIVVSDYGHHPTEIEVTLKAAREKWPQKEIWCVYQPHQYQRTLYLFNDFVKVLRRVPVNKVLVTDIYDVAGREEKKIKKKVNAEKLVKKINREKVIYLPTEKVVNFVKKNFSKNYVLVIMGAGDIYKLSHRLVDEMVFSRRNLKNNRIFR